MHFIGAGLGEDLDPSITHLIVLGGVWVLVDADLANRRLGRHLASRKSVDIKLRRSVAGVARHALQLLQHLLAVIRHRRELRPLQYDRIGVVGRVVDRIVLTDLHLLLLRLNGEFYLYRSLLMCGQHNGGDRRRSEAWGFGVDRIRARRQRRDRVTPQLVGDSAQLLARRAGRVDLRTGDHRPGGIGDRTAQRCVRLRLRLSLTRKNSWRGDSVLALCLESQRRHRCHQRCAEHLSSQG